MLSKSLIIKETPIKNKSIGSQLSKLRARKSDNAQAGENVGGIGTLLEGRLKIDRIFLESNLAKHMKALSSKEFDANSPFVKLHLTEPPRLSGQRCIYKTIQQGEKTNSSPDII